MDSGPADETRSIIFFDGVCNLCSRWVRFVLARDRDKRFAFAPLQSAVAKEILERFEVNADELETMALVEGDRCSTKSSAALRVARRLPGPWPALYIFILVPRPLRDWVYGLIARNRYRWFGRSEQCFAPTPELKERFLG